MRLSWIHKLAGLSLAFTVFLFIPLLFNVDNHIICQRWYFVNFISLWHFQILHFLKKNFFYFWLCWVFVSVRGLSLVAASGGHSSSQCAGLSLSRLLLLQSTGSRRAGSVVVGHGPSCSAACGLFPDQGSNPCPLHWQADSQPLRHQGSPKYCTSYVVFLSYKISITFNHVNQ